MKYLPVVSRSLIALLFVVAGIQKLMSFTMTVGYVDSLGVPLATVATALVILIEVPIALLFAFGYKKCLTGSILAGFVLITTLLAHNDWSNSVNMIMTLKNIAIIGGILAIIGTCDCEKCPTNEEKAA